MTNDHSECVGEGNDGCEASNYELISTVYIIRHAHRGPLYPSKDSDLCYGWEANQYEQLTPKGKEAANLYGMEIASNRSTTFSHGLSPDNVYFRSTNVPRTEDTAINFMKGFLKDNNYEIVKQQPQAKPYHSEKFILNIMPQEGNKLSSRDFLLESATVKWRRLQESQSAYDLRKTALDYEATDFRADSGYTGNIDHLSDILKCYRDNNMSCNPNLDNDLQTRAISLGEHYKILEYTLIDKACTKVHDLLLHVKAIFNANLTPKLRFYFTHDTNIISAMTMFEVLLESYPPYLATLKFEQFQKEGEIFIKSSYNNAPITTICSKVYCSLTSFSVYIDSQLRKCVAIDKKSPRTL